MSDVSARMRRLFNPKSGRCFDIAVDHGFFGEASFLAGIEDLQSAVEVLVDAAPDAIQMTIGQSRILQGLGGRERPALVLRTDIANVYGAPLPDYMFDLIIPERLRDRHWTGYRNVMATGVSAYGTKLLEVPAASKDGHLAVWERASGLLVASHEESSDTDWECLAASNDEAPN